MNCMYYIDYKSDDEKNIYKKIYNKIFFKYEVVIFDEDKKLININRNCLNKSIEKRINKHCVIDNEYRDYGLLISNKIKTENCLKNYEIFHGKILMTNIIVNLIEYIEDAIGTDFRNEDIFICTCNDKYKELIIDVAKKFRCTNIITDKIKKLKRLENVLSKEGELIYSISNNRKKSLRRAKIVINIDFDKEQFEEFSLNRYCIIINLSNKILELKSSFHGTIVELAEINYKNRYENFININEFDKVKLYESYIYSKNYNEAKKYIQDDNCTIEILKGKKSEIRASELKNNFRNSTRKLDKIQKKD